MRKIRKPKTRRKLGNKTGQSLSSSSRDTQLTSSNFEFSFNFNFFGDKVEKVNKDLAELNLNSGSSSWLEKIKGNAQEWLDKNYPIEEREKVKEIHLTEPSLEGELDLGDFTYESRLPYAKYDVKICISFQVDETKLTFKNLPRKVKIIKLIQAQEYLNQQHPTKEEKEKVEKLDIDFKNLEGDLDLSGFVNLKKLNCCGNKLTSLIISKCFKLESVFCCYNQLVNLDASNCSYLVSLDCDDNLLTNLALPTKISNLEYLDLSDNNFPTQDLSFLTEAINLEELCLGNYDENKVNQNIYNRFIGSLNYLSNMKQLKKLNISNTDINEIDIDKLPRSLWEIEYSTKRRPECKLTEIALWLKEELKERYDKYDWCQKCFQLNTSPGWCQPCADKEWQESINQLAGQELVEKVGERWIPYEQFTNIKQIGEGGFSKIYKAKWGEEYGRDRMIVLKVLTNSQNITLEFLTEITNSNLFLPEELIIRCYGISQDPETKNYVMVMEYMDGGNLRQYLQNKNNESSLEDKVRCLSCITEGLSNIHYRNLIHQDFHSGNVLLSGDDGSSSISDLGLCRAVNYQKEAGKIFGVLSYVAPEVLQGQPYTQKSDIYSFGIIAYELLANEYPYLEMNDINLVLKVCDKEKPLRPNIDKVPILQPLKDLIKECWNADPTKRPSAEELREIIDKIEYKEIEQEYNTFSRNTPYQIHPTVTTTSKMIDTKQITQQLEKLKTVEEYHTKALEELTLDNINLDKLNIQEDTQEQSSFQAQIQQPPK